MKQILYIAVSFLIFVSCDKLNNGLTFSNETSGPITIAIKYEQNAATTVNTQISYFTQGIVSTIPQNGSSNMYSFSYSDLSAPRFFYFVAHYSSNINDNTRNIFSNGRIARHYRFSILNDADTWVKIKDSQIEINTNFGISVD